MSGTVMEPRMRVSKSSALTLSINWQKIIFDGTDTLNVNTFGKDPISGNPMVRWDTTNNMFKFYNISDTNYKATLFMRTVTNLLTTRAMLQYRCVVPNGISAGNPLYYPFTADGGYADVFEVTVTGTQHNTPVDVPLYLNDTIRTNGMYIEVKLSNALISLGVCNLTSAAFLIQSSKG